MRYSQAQKKALLQKIKDPVYFAENILGLTGDSELWSKQKEILQAVKDHKRVAVRSSNGVGKTFTASVVVLWFLYAHQRSRVITTAPTWKQVEKLLWSEIKTQYNKAKVPLGGKLIQTELRLDSDWFAVGLSTNDETNFQGHHAEDILIVFDEALGVADPIWNAAEGNLTSSNAKHLVIGNPVSPVGNFYQCFKSPIWHKIKISAFDSPNFQGGGVVKPKLVTPDWVEERKKEWGENSPIYKARVLGEFPIEGEDTLIPLTWVEKAIDREIKQEEKPIVLGVDVARFGSDSTAFVVLEGKKIIHIEGYVGKETTKTAGRAIQLHKQFNCEKIMVDDVGVGGGVTDMLTEQDYPVEGVSFGASPNDSERFDNLKTEIFWNLRDDFENDEISIPNNEHLLEELPSLMYEITSRGKLKIVSKDKMKKAGIKSPDYADALAIAHYGTYSSRRGILDFYKEESEEYGEQESVESFFNRPDLTGGFKRIV